MIKKSSKVHIILAVFAVIVGFTFFSYLYSQHLFQSEGVLRAEGSLLEESSPGESAAEAPAWAEDLSFRLMPTSRAGEYTYQARISREQLPPAPSGLYRVLIYRVAGESLVLQWNGQTIVTAGNMENNRTNLWNAQIYGDIPPEKIKEKNLLSLTVQASYEFGGMAHPLFVMGAHQASRMESWFAFHLTAVPFLAEGCLFFAFILFLFMSSIIPGLVRREYLFYSIASLLMAVNLLDYVTFSSFPLPLFITKKITLSALYLSVSFIQLGICEQFQVNKKLSWGFSAIFPLILLVLWLIPDPYWFKNIYRQTNMLILGANLSWIVVSGLHIRKHEYARVLFSASLVMLFFAFADVFSHMTSSVFVFSLTVIGTLLFVLGLSFHVVFDYLDMLKKLSMESRRAEFHYNKSIRDSMTGLYNHKFIMTAVTNIAVPYSVMMIDADHFKEINDNYGHETGDEVIMMIAGILKASVRADDLVGRYGGDEFMLLLHNCPEETALRIAGSIARDLSKKSLDTPGIPGPVSLSIGIYASSEHQETGEESLRRADQALYEAKERGRGRGVSCHWDKGELVFKEVIPVLTPQEPESSPEDR